MSVWVGIDLANQLIEIRVLIIQLLSTFIRWIIHALRLKRILNDATRKAFLSLSLSPSSLFNFFHEATSRILLIHCNNHDDSSSQFLQASTGACRRYIILLSSICRGPVYIYTSLQFITTDVAMAFPLIVFSVFH